MSRKAGEDEGDRNNSPASASALTLVVMAWLLGLVVGAVTMGIKTGPLAPMAPLWLLIETK